MRIARVPNPYRATRASLARAETIAYDATRRASRDASDSDAARLPARRSRARFRRRTRRRLFDASTLRRFARGRAGPPRRSLTPTLLSFPVRLQSSSFAAKSLLARAGAPERQCSVPGGALHVLSDPSAAVQVFRRDDLVLALRADGVTLEQFVAAYDATAGSANGDTRARVNAMRDALGDVHTSSGAFAAVADDAAVGRVLAARTAGSTPLAYGFTADGALVACAGLREENLFPDAPGAIALTPLPSGRFVFGHRYVKPIEFTSFWATAASNRAAAPARHARQEEAPRRRVSAIVEESDLADVVDSPESPSRWGTTGGRADGCASWKSAEESTGKASAGAYVPPAMRAARAAAEKAAAEKAAAEKAEAEKAEAEKAVLAAQKAEADAQVAKALQAQERVVSSLESALATAVRRTSVDGGLRPNKFKAASRLRSATMDSGGWDRALATMRGDAAKRRTSMENCARSSADLGRRQSLGGFDAIQRRSLMGL